MERLKMTLSEKTNLALEKDYNEALKDENFKNLVHNLKISKEIGNEKYFKTKR